MTRNPESFVISERANPFHPVPGYPAFPVTRRRLELLIIRPDKGEEGQKFGFNYLFYSASKKL